MIIAALGAAAKEPDYFPDGVPMVVIAVKTKGDFVLDGIGTVLVRFVAIAVGCGFAHNGEELTDGVGIHMVSLLLEVVVQLAEARIGLLGESHRHPDNQEYKCIASVHDNMLFNCS